MGRVESLRMILKIIVGNIDFVEPRQSREQGLVDGG